MFFGWKFIKDFPSSHIHKWKRFGPGLFWCRTIFFLSYSVFACAMYWFFVITFFFLQLPYHYFSRQKVLTQWAQPSFHYPRSYHHLFFIGTNSMFACFQMYVKSTFFLFFFFFFNFHMIFFSPHTCVDSVGATIFAFPIVIQLNVFIAVPNHFAFWKSKIFTSFNLKKAMQLSSTNVMKMTWKQNKQSQKAFRRQNVQ